MTPPRTADRLLDAAEDLVQTRGFNGFSFADLALAVGISKPSIHYHFPTKADLGRLMLQRYNARFAARCSEISRRATSTRQALTDYARLYEAVLAKKRMCLCGMMAAEFATLTPDVQAEILNFMKQNELWLVEVLGTGKKTGDIAPRIQLRSTAKYILSTLEGAMLVARVSSDVKAFKATALRIIDDLCRARPRKKTRT